MRKLVIALTAATAIATARRRRLWRDPEPRRATPPPRSRIRNMARFGFDAAGMDRNVAPGDSFYRYANGNWDRATEIPADRSNYGMFIVLDDLSRSRTHTILEEAARTPGSRIGDFYASFMDEAAVNAAGIAPIRPLLDEVRGIRDRSQWAAELGRMLRRSIRTPFGAFVDSDERIPTQMILHLQAVGPRPSRPRLLSQRRCRRWPRSAPPIRPISPSC